MPKLKKISGEEAIRALEQFGFIRTRQRGSHVILKKQTTLGYIGCVVPLHKELKIGTLLGILKQAKIDPEDFSKLL
ncbi:MAG: type II toxin-antitoxin system HicA family toxin [Bacteroidetes bacterium]|nr:type II toxin-antitoxin system HicA family toxin [Bacteroidota bacterium]MCL6099111.1 type II toxin-antitoxin system HicA family toxin [Bacteroidota bacterium]